MKRLIILGIIIMTSLFALSACGSNDDTEESNVGASEASKENLDSVVRAGLDKSREIEEREMNDDEDEDYYDGPESLSREDDSKGEPKKQLRKAEDLYEEADRERFIALDQEAELDKINSLKEDKEEQKVGQGCSYEGSIDINNASKEEVKSIIHIDEERSDALVATRDYDSVEDLSQLYGIGPERLADIITQGFACVK